jgi:hypothetical protein
MQITVELRPHVHYRKTALGRVPVVYAQSKIFARDASDPTSQWILVGYVGTQPDAPINYLRAPDGLAWPEPIKQIIRAAIADQMGAGQRRESQPPDPQRADPEPAEDLQDEDLD